MPNPSENESRDDFLQRCIPQVIHEGKPRDQAVAICNSLWEQRKMLYELDDILKSKRSGRWGIGTAAVYMRSFAGCLGDGFCPVTGIAPDDWAKAIKDAERKLTYCDESMLVKAFQSSDIPDGGVMNYTTVITSKRKDRDRDVLEPKGATVDPHHPLLWQHNHLHPIGKFLQTMDHDENKIVGEFSIIDMPLGRDAAQLVRFGALRTSHGFDPEEFEPLKDKSDPDAGWHVLKYTIMETSLVSVPSNVDAMILGFTEKSYEKAFAQELDGIRTVAGRGMLKTDVMKQWADAVLNSRPKQVAVGEMVVKVDASELKEQIDRLEIKSACTCKSADEKSDMQCPKCGYVGDMKPTEDDDEGKSFIDAISEWQKDAHSVELDIAIGILNAELAARNKAASDIAWKQSLVGEFVAF